MFGNVSGPTLFTEWRLPIIVTWHFVGLTDNPNFPDQLSIALRSVFILSIAAAISSKLHDMH